MKCTLTIVAGVGLVTLAGCETPPTYRALMQDILLEADYWEDEPRILAVGLGFTDVNGTPGVSLPLDLAEFAVFINGGAWNTIDADVDPGDVPLRAYTSAVSPIGMWLSFGVPSFYGDGTPMELSWPVLPSTVHPEDILITLNTGEQVQPVNISVMPNFEYNERSTLVMNGDFGNRFDPDEPGAVYPVLFEIVDDGTPMMLLGPGGRIESAVGLNYGDGTTPLTAYGEGNGPRLCAAKLTHMADGLLGEGGPAFFSGSLPNDGVTLYGADAQYRLRVLTTGGFSPDGVRSLYPTEFSSFFRIKVCLSPAHGEVIWLEETGVPYAIGDLGTIEILGLADLGPRWDVYDDIYIEDHDNQIDIILKGDAAAMRCIRAVHIPASGDYLAFYNPGGPGNNPFPAVTYTSAGPEWLQPVTIALDDPMQVSHLPK